MTRSKGRPRQSALRGGAEWSTSEVEDDACAHAFTHLPSMSRRNTQINVPLEIGPDMKVML